MGVYAISILIFGILGFLELPYILVSLILLSVYALYVFLVFWRENHPEIESGGLIFELTKKDFERHENHECEDSPTIKKIRRVYPSRIEIDKDCSSELEEH